MTRGDSFLTVGNCQFAVGAGRALVVGILAKGAGAVIGLAGIGPLVKCGGGVTWTARQAVIAQEIITISLFVNFIYHFLNYFLPKYTYSKTADHAILGIASFYPTSTTKSHIRRLDSSSVFNLQPVVAL